MGEKHNTCFLSSYKRFAYNFLFGYPIIAGHK